MPDSRVRVEPVVSRVGDLGGGEPPLPAVRKFLLLAPGGIAEMVWALPAFQALRAAYPRAWGALCVSRRCLPLAGLVRGCSQVVEEPATAEGFLALFRAIGPDLLVDATGGTRVAWAAARAKVPHRVGIPGRFRRALYERALDERKLPEGLHRVERKIALARKAGAAETPPWFGLVPVDSAREATAHWLAEHRLEKPWVLLLPGTDPTRASWPAAHFARLAVLLAGEGIGVAFALSLAAGPAGRVLDGSSIEVRRIPRFHGGPPSLAALLAQASVVVGNVSGPVQVGAALGVPAISLHPPWEEWSISRTGPYSPEGKGIVAVGESSREPRRGVAEKGSAAMGLISPAAVLGAVMGGV